MASCILCAEETRFSVKTLGMRSLRTSQPTPAKPSAPLCCSGSPSHAPEFFHAIYHIRVSCVPVSPVAAGVPGQLYGLGEDDDNPGTPTAGQQSGYRILARQLCARGGNRNTACSSHVFADARQCSKTRAGRERQCRKGGREARRTSLNSQSEGRVACHASGCRRNQNLHLIDSARQCCTPATQTLNLPVCSGPTILVNLCRSNWGVEMRIRLGTDRTKLSAL